MKDRYEGLAHPHTLNPNMMTSIVSKKSGGAVLDSCKGLPVSVVHGFSSSSKILWNPWMHTSFMVH
jgi:hypothetical protein